MTNYLQTRPHRTKLYLSVYQPDTVLACQVNDPTISKGEREITYNLVSSGSYLGIKSGMVMYVGSSAGKSDKGRVRVRSATSTVITVAENDHINWSDNDHLTVVYLWNIDAIFPRIIQDPANELDVIFYKDWDITYGDQNRYVGGFLNMGSHYAGFLDPNTGEHDVYYDASGTVALTGAFTSFDWFVQGATVTGSSSMRPEYHTYDTAGHYTTELSITGTTGYEVSYRHVSIYDRPGEGDNTPILQWELEDLQGSRDKGGYTARIRVRQSVDQEFVREGSLIIIFADDWYGGVQHSLGGNQTNREKIVFVGYVVDGSVVYDYQSSFVSFEAESVTGIMKRAEGFSISVESKTSPAKWYELYQMDLQKAIHHLLKWHSTVSLCADVKYPSTSFNEEIQFFDADRESVYDAVNSLLQGASFGKIVSDRQGIIWCETEPYANPTDPDATDAIEKVDWMGEPEFVERLTEEISWLEIGGIAFELTGASGTSTPLISAAPGETPGYRGKIQRQQGLALTDQAQLNTLSGNLYAHYNSRYPDLSVQLAGNYRNYDIAPVKKVPITITSGDTVRDITLTNEPFIINSMLWSYNPSTESFFPVVSLYQLKRGFAGDTITIPVEPPTEGDGGGFEQLPPFDLPPIPPLPDPDPIQRLELYDEGIFLGLVSGLNFTGDSVVASVTGSVAGVATYTCTVGSDTVIGVFRNNGIGESWSAGEQLVKKKFSFETNEFTQAMTYDVVNKRITFLDAGTYVVNYAASLTSLTEHFEDFPGTYFNFKFYINHYNSSDVLQSTHVSYSDRSFLYEIDDGGWTSDGQNARGGDTFALSVSANDYLEVESEGTPTLAMPMNLTHDILVYKI